jgi:diguanylate cyclase (GGDEF)-like protein
VPEVARPIVPQIWILAPQRSFRIPDDVLLTPALSSLDKGGGMRAASDRRAKLEHGRANKSKGPAGVSSAQAWTIVVIGLSVTGLTDWLTAEAWFGPLYLLLIGVAAWSFGWRAAVAIGLACMAITLSANGLSLYPYGTAAAFWNMAARGGAVVLTIALVEIVRKSYAMQWRLARTDPLTGTLNRQAFFESVAADHCGAWSMLAYLDIDGLKKLNDKHGHMAGDERLRSFAEHVKRLIRTKDMFARIGGDEFLIYMNIKDEVAAKHVAMRLHLALNSGSGETAERLSCSVGALVLPPGTRNLDAELRLADQLMYEAKQLRASIAVATAGIRDGKLQLIRHPELSQSFDSNGAVMSRRTAHDLRVSDQRGATSIGGSDNDLDNQTAARAAAA